MSKSATKEGTTPLRPKFRAAPPRAISRNAEAGALLYRIGTYLGQPELKDG